MKSMISESKPEAAGRYDRPGIYTGADQLKVGLFTDLAIDLNLVFSE